MADDVLIHNVKFDERGLIPAIVQDAATLEVVALAYLDNLRLARALQTGETRFLGDMQSLANMSDYRLLDVRVDADGGSLIVLIERQTGEARERETVSLMNASVNAGRSSEVELVDVASMEFGLGLYNLYALIAERKDKRPEGSYTTYLFNSGLDKILKKVAEESGEVIIAAKNKVPREIISELADLFYHLLVLMVERDVKLGEVASELTRRAAPRAKRE
ncbi:MAG TPA: phosphoribosyl-ATP diphosphatase [Blastocatellia bacterium]|nr:phosphoribosyl-ATP diphosphatase [Blastocatellia bacterium]